MGLIICVVGKPKTGKTVSACTFPKPALLLDFDKGFDSVKNTTSPNEKLVVPDWKEIQVIEFYKEQQADLSFKSYGISKGGVPSGTPEYAMGANDVIIKYNSLMKELFNKGTVTINGTEVGPFQTFIIDPLTSMFRIWKDAILHANNIAELRRGDYMTLEGVLANQFIPNLKALSDKIPFIICIDHEDFDSTEKGDVIAEYAVGPSKNLGKNLSEFFDELWRMNADEGGNYSWRTKNHFFFRGAGSRSHLPDPIKPALYSRLKEILDARGKETVK